MSAETALAVEWLQEAWFELRNGASPAQRNLVEGAIGISAAMGILDAEQAELWRRRILTCPGHDDEGGRDWCAYCGQMPFTDPT